MQIAGNSATIQLGTNTRQSQQGFRLGRKCQELTVLYEVEWLDTESIPTNQQATPGRIPQGEGKHAIEPQYKVIALRVIEMQQHLAV